MKNFVKIATILGAATILIGCASFQTQNAMYPNASNQQGMSYHNGYYYTQSHRAQYNEHQFQQKNSSYNPIGAAVGTVAGGIIGAQIGKGSGQVAATAAGAAIGSVVGSGCKTINSGQVLGALAGGIIGSQVGNGNGRLAAAAIGSAIGAQVGNEMSGGCQ